MRTRTLPFAVAAIALALLTSQASYAALEMFLNLEGIPGESRDKDHRDWIEIESFSWGMANPVSFGGGGGGGAGVAQFEDLTLTGHLEKAAPELALRSAMGLPIPQARLVVRSPDPYSPHIFYTITLKDAYVTSVSVSGDREGSRPSQTFTLAYAEIEWTYTPLRADGQPGMPITRKWNLLQNKG